MLFQKRVYNAHEQHIFRAHHLENLMYYFLLLKYVEVYIRFEGRTNECYAFECYVFLLQGLKKTQYLEVISITLLIHK